MGKMVEGVITLAAVGCIAMAVGCATAVKEKVAYSCDSQGALEALQKENQALRATVEKAKQFSVGCLAGFKKADAAAKDCKDKLEVAENQK